MKKKGVSATVTPLLEDGSLDRQGLCNLIDRGAGHKLDGMFLYGSMGEWGGLSGATKLAGVELASSYVKDRFELLVGINATSLPLSLALMEEYRKYDFAAYVFMPPGHTSRLDPVKSVLTVLDKADRPVYLYHCPPANGINFPLKDFETMMRHPNLNYFSDHRQGIPLTGYNSLFDRLLDHPGVTVECNVAFDLGTARRLGLPEETPVFYSGPIDALFGYRFGALPWRSLRFERETLDMADFQGTSVMNYTGADVPFTRIHEFKHFHPENKEVMARPKTVVCREYPKTWQAGDEPYYAVDTAESRALLERYRAEAAKVPGLVVGGRLGEYRYYDMDQSVGRGLDAAHVFLSKTA